jgi:hypothetical protein
MGGEETEKTDVKRQAFRRGVWRRGCRGVDRWAFLENRVWEKDP